ncbi:MULTISPECIES: hypothetical protein [Methylocaldum]|jgi:hypothetical protein|uniref:hypothetical protein n=1 Tax=unclassified Methylocaldum TaxID=2622260 RepID=UPI0010617D68|nr:hypothetical protein [Methylocaldum sp. BRCS4]
MKTNPHNERASDLEIYTFRLRFEGSTDIPLETGGYWCDAEGRLIEGADAVNGKLLLALTEPELKHGRLLIAPVSPDTFRAGRLTADDLRSYDAFEPRALFDPGLRHHTLPEIPESVWRFWFIYRQFALGRPRRSQAAIQSW